jgi:hypothetical protein
MKHSKSDNNNDNNINNNRNNDYDDDGWGSSLTKTKNASNNSNMNNENDLKRDKMMKEIIDLQQQKSSSINDQTSNKDVSATNSSKNGDDLFIPIVTIVSIIGFVGAYMYETIRLYNNGELYLPFWTNQIEEGIHKIERKQIWLIVVYECSCCIFSAKKDTTATMEKNEDKYRPAALLFALHSNDIGH